MPGVLPAKGYQAPVPARSDRTCICAALWFTLRPRSCTRHIAMPWRNLAAKPIAYMSTIPTTAPPHQGRSRCRRVRHRAHVFKYLNALCHGIFLRMLAGSVANLCSVGSNRHERGFAPALETRPKSPKCYENRSCIRLQDVPQWHNFVVETCGGRRSKTSVSRKGFSFRHEAHSPDKEPFHYTGYQTQERSRGPCRPATAAAA